MTSAFIEASATVRRQVAVVNGRRERLTRLPDAGDNAVAVLARRAHRISGLMEPYRLINSRQHSAHTRHFATASSLSRCIRPQPRWTLRIRSKPGRLVAALQAVRR